jgi:flagellar biosynthesis anti-sigma factor FlgM
MKVQGAGKPHVGQIQDKVQIKDKQETPASSAGGERVAVSSLSKLLANIRAPEQTDTAKVEQLRQSISAGAFKVDPNKVAETMVHEEV